MSAENKENKDKKSMLPKAPKLGAYWLYILLGVGLLFILGPNLFKFGNDPRNKDKEFFRQQSLMAHDVEKVIVVNDRLVEVYLKEE